MAKVSRFTYSDSEGQMDKLPDEILVLVLSNLTLKEAARTSVLSHRWENLWTYYSGSLNFDGMDAMVSIILGKTREEFERFRYANWVNRILYLHQGQTVDELRVLFDLDEKFAGDIEAWIKFAIEKRVCRFELDLSAAYGHTKADLYPFPYKLLYQPGDFLTSFGFLITLRLNSVDLSDEVLAYFILNCQSLEQLSIKGALSLTCLKATGALKLKHLEIEYCNGLEKIEIANTNIESLEFTGSTETQIPFGELPLLSEVSLGCLFSTSVIRCRLWPLPVSQLRTLQLHLHVGFCIRPFPERFPTCINLKHLEVRLTPSHDESLFCLTSLIYASPNLSRFTVKVDCRPPYDPKGRYKLLNCRWRKAEKHVHRCLKVVEFIGWYGYENDLEFVSYLIEIGPLLEKVVIDAHVPLFGRRILCPREEREREKERVETCRNGAKQLKEKIPTGIELVIL